MARFVKAIIQHERTGYAYPDAVLAEGVRRALAMLSLLVMAASFAGVWQI